MKTAKSYKLLILTILCMAMLMLGFVFNTSFKAFAQAGSDSPASYFSGTELKYEDSKVKAKANDTTSFAFNWSIVCNETEIKFSVDDKVNVLTMTFDVDSNYIENETLNKELKITFGDTNMSVKYDGETTPVTNSRDILIKTSVVNNYLCVLVNNVEVSKVSNEPIKNAGLAPMKNVKFSFDTDESVDGVFALEYVDTKTSDITGAYKQTFELENGKVKTLAKPRAKFNDDMYMADNTISLRDGKQYSVSITSYSLTAVSDYNNMYVGTNNGGTNNSNVWFANATLPKSFVISLKSGITFDDTLSLAIKSTVSDYDTVEVIPVKVYGEYTATKPTYNYDLDALDRYLEAVEDATKVEYEEGVESYVRLGDDYTIPSLKELITETVTPYAQMKAIVYYMTPSNDINTTSSLSIFLDTAGDYKFFVVFEDEFGNVLTQDDFYTVNDNDSNDISFTSLGEKYIFSFHIEDDAPLSVLPAEEQGEGYKGAEYHATKFDITAYNYTTTYKLYYNENVNAENSSQGWNEIIKSSSLNDNYEEDYFTSDEIKEIAYDGELAFTPNKIGAYKITCEVSSSHTSREAEAYSIIKVKSETKTLASDSDWAVRNVWSIVFLSVGTLCLIGIIVLLFVKPKEKQTEVE